MASERSERDTIRGVQFQAGAVYIYLEHGVTKYANLIGPLVNLFHLESRPSALRKHLPKALFKLAVWKEVGNARQLATIPFV